MPIQSIFFNPPLSVARLGGSSVPMDAFSWIASEEPHLIGETQIRPEWTLDVQSDGGIVPRKPDRLVLKDEGKIRPVAPFLELWCDVGDAGDQANWTRQPLTSTLLAAEGFDLSGLTFTVTAMNRKASRRTGNPAHRFGTFPPVTITGNDHAPNALRGSSPPVAVGQVPMIPADRFIPLGSVQVIRPGRQPAESEGVLWAGAVNVETIRLRFTPARGEFFGPPGSEQVVQPPSRSGGFSAVPPGNSFLNAAAGWFGARTEGVQIVLGQPPSGLVVPADTYDGAELSNQSDPSLGIIDDACEILVEASLGQGLNARANVFCGPPDYAPDRRPFLSLADDLNDRAGDRAVRSDGMSDEDLDRWVEDLFERAFETVSLFNVDFWRRLRSSDLRPQDQRPAPIPDDATRDPTSAMGGRDALRDGNIALPAPSANLPLPVSGRAQERHRDLSDIFALKRFVRENPARLGALIRRPFSVSPIENGSATTMQMPPFMRQSNAEPLSLAVWQYDLLMEWQQRVLTGAETLQERSGVSDQLSEAAAARRARVLQRLGNLRESL
jgi:hypothetical protein